MATNLSHGGPNINPSSQPDNALLVATVDGVVKLQRTAPGAPWKESAHWLQGKHVAAIMQEPTRGILFAGTHGQGLHSSDDGGETWQVRARGLVSEHIYSMNCVQSGGKVLLYAGTEPANLHVSEDLGATWRVLPSVRLAPSIAGWRFPAPPHSAHLKSIGFDPRSADTIYASVEVGALLKSTDAGATWRELTGEGTGLYEDVHRVAITASDPDHVYTATGNGIYHSRDAGDSWERLTDQSLRVGYPDALILHPERPGLLFTAGALIWPRDWSKVGSADPRIMRSTDGG
ncbi:MAG: YCF48-related protein, partial [Chloroflexota bacterium]